MPAILFLITPDDPHNDNHVRLPQMFAEQGWRVATASHEAIHAHGAAVFAGDADLADYDRVWPIGFGPARTYLDRASLLRGAENLITPVDALTFLHPKSAWLEFLPETYLSSDGDRLAGVVAHAGGEWVLKPNAGSLGRAVHRVSTHAAVRAIVAQASPRIWLLQRYVHEIESGEARTLVCGDALLGSYLRSGGPDFRTNLALDARAQPGAPDPRAAPMIERVFRKLRGAGVGFAAIDTAGPHLIEVNVANPGGISTLERLYDINLDTQLVGAAHAH